MTAETKGEWTADEWSVGLGRLRRGGELVGITADLAEILNAAEALAAAVTVGYHLVSASTHAEMRALARYRAAVGKETA